MECLLSPYKKRNSLRCNFFFSPVQCMLSPHLEAPGRGRYSRNTRRMNEDGRCQAGCYRHLIHSRNPHSFTYRRAWGHLALRGGPGSSRGSQGAGCTLRHRLWHPYPFLRLTCLSWGVTPLLTGGNVLLSVLISSVTLKIPSRALLTIPMRTGKQFILLVLHATENL